MDEVRRRHWANVAVILAGLYTLAFAIWTPPIGDADRAGEMVRGEAFWWAVHALAAGFALGALFVALWKPVAARAMVLVAGVMLLLGLFVFGRPGIVSIVSLAVPAVLLLGAAPFLGPMPVPEEDASAPAREPAPGEAVRG